MSGTTVLRARATHLYPGARGLCAGRPADGGCLVAFADGTAAVAALSTGPDGARRLETGAHVTARGARIPARLWSITVNSGEWRILRRLPRPPDAPAPDG